MEKLAYTPNEALQGPLKGLLGRGLLYERLKSCEIPSIRLGKKYLIPVAGLCRLLNSATRANAPDDEQQ